MSGVRIPPPRPTSFGFATEEGVSLRVSAAGSLLALLDGGCSSPGRAPDCGSGGSGFETRQPPHLFIDSDLLFFLALLFDGALGGFRRHRAMPHRRQTRRLTAGGCCEVRFKREKKRRGNPCPCNACLRPGSYGLPWPPETPCRPDMSA